MWGPGLWSASDSGRGANRAHQCPDGVLNLWRLGLAQRSNLRGEGRGRQVSRGGSPGGVTGAKVEAAGGSAGRRRGVLWVRGGEGAESTTCLAFFEGLEIAHQCVVAAAGRRGARREGSLLFLWDAWRRKGRRWSAEPMLLGVASRVCNRVSWVKAAFGAPFRAT